MQLYRNLSGNSGVRWFELGDGSITVGFYNGSTYIYTTSSSGIRTIEEMTRLALSGRGLGSYITRIVKKRYEKKL